MRLAIFIDENGDRAAISPDCIRGVAEDANDNKVAIGTTDGAVRLDSGSMSFDGAVAEINAALRDEEHERNRAMFAAAASLSAAKGFARVIEQQDAVNGEDGE
jgi:hypothetical protein